MVRFLFCLISYQFSFCLNLNKRFWNIKRGFHFLFSSSSSSTDKYKYGKILRYRNGLLFKNKIQIKRKNNKNLYFICLFFVVFYNFVDFLIDIIYSFIRIIIVIIPQQFYFGLFPPENIQRKNIWNFWNSFVVTHQSQRMVGRGQADWWMDGRAS